MTVEGDLVGNSTTPVIISARGEAMPSGNTDVAMQSLTVNGSVTYALILGGYDVNGQGVNADAQIGSITVTGDWAASSLATGVTPGPDGLFGTDDDAELSGPGVKDDPNVLSQIGSVVIGGAVSGSGVSGDHFGFVAEWVVAFRMGGVDIPLNDGPHNDNVPLTKKGDVNILEVPDDKGRPFAGDPVFADLSRRLSTAAVGDWRMQVPQAPIASSGTRWASNAPTLVLDLDPVSLRNDQTSNPLHPYRRQGGWAAADAFYVDDRAFDSESLDPWLRLAESAER
jgi:hypothetical protein